MLILQISFFVVYNYVTTEVKSVYENTSEELLDMFERYCDFFRNTNLNFDDHRDLRFCSRTSSPSNNIHADLIQQRFKQTIVSARDSNQCCRQFHVIFHSRRLLSRT